MQMASIVPQNLLEVTEESRFHMALAHLINKEGYEQYTKFFYDKGMRGDYIVLDSGAAEGEMIPFKEIVKKAEQIHASEVILPDILLNCELTLKAHEEAVSFLINKYGDITNCPFKLMCVPQGKNEEEFFTCAKTMLSSLPVQVIGIPKNLTKICNKRDARLFFISILEATDLLEGIEIHLLGCGNSPIEVLTISKASDTKLINTVRSCDSAIPYVYARNGLKFSDSDRPDQEPIDFKQGFCNHIMLAYNVASWNAIGNISAENFIWLI